MEESSIQTLTVFYAPEQNVENNDSYSPSAGKPSRVLADFLTGQASVPKNK